MDKNEIKTMQLNTYKAGMDGLDTDRINEIIMEASKGSKFYSHKEKRQKQIEEKIKNLKATAETISKQELDYSTKIVDQYIASLEYSRDLSRIIMHIDMDAFYASVEMRDNPSLKDKPMAVGSLEMLCTSNYAARRFGVRAAMPGFIGKKLCPHLVLVETNFTKYTAESKKIQEILKSYDPDFNSVGLDEAYLDLTEYLASLEGFESEQDKVSTIVNKIRLAIFEKTGLTASAGIAPNMLLAKIASDVNKPNGQFIVESNAKKIKEFMSLLRIRKISGLGPVAEQQLNALGIEKCSDILDKRSLIWHLFSSVSSKFFIDAALGIGSTNVKSDHNRKSMSVERTFSEINQFEKMLQKCEELCEELIQDMKEHNICGKTVTLKLKTVEFKVKTRSHSLQEYSSDYQSIFKVASKLLKAECQNSQNLKLRLMGVRISNIKSKLSNEKIQSMFKNFHQHSDDKSYPVCPVCNRQQHSDNIQKITKHIEECLGIDSEEEFLDQPTIKNDDLFNASAESEKDSYTCPICRAKLFLDLQNFNKHIDSCLNAGTIKEMLASDKDNSCEEQSKNSIKSFFKVHPKDDVIFPNSSKKAVEKNNSPSKSKFHDESSQRDSHDKNHKEASSLGKTSNKKLEVNCSKSKSRDDHRSKKRHETLSNEHHDNESKRLKYDNHCGQSRDKKPDDKMKSHRSKSDNTYHRSKNKDPFEQKHNYRKSERESEAKKFKAGFKEECETTICSIDDRLSKLDSNVSTDINFQWKGMKSTLNRMFFSDSDFISRGSKELNDFWEFLAKFQRMQRQRLSRGESTKLGSIPPPPDFSLLNDIPETFLDNLKEKYEVSSLKSSINDLYFKVHFYDEESQKDLPVERVKEFRYIIKLYISFCMKQEFGKVKKLRQNQQNLPIFQYKKEILETLKSNQVILIAGDTGCGKSTQVPQYLLRGGFTNIACTQPRRIACVSLSKRVSYETLNQYRSEVGYQIRFEKNKTQHTRILFLTEGLLLRQVCSDHTLESYNVIVLDEVHERHLHGDFLLGVIKCLIMNRSDLKVVLMSATINIELFTRYFNYAPVIQVPGRLFPIKVNYMPISLMEKSSKSSRIDPGPYIKVLQIIDQTIPETERGDLLIFLSGMAEISSVADAATVYAEQTKRWIILPLHSTLSIAEQDKAFDTAPEGVRKCIISTNIAETSITIDGIRFVTDSGKVKEMNYDTTCKMQKLQEFWISRASAEQRKGRAGRTGPGICYRLYAESQYNEMDAYSTPEIQRVPLDTLVLQMLAMGLPDPRKFPFIQAPPLSSIENSVISLIDHGALTASEELTSIGKMLSRLPVDISIGKMLIMGSLFKMVEPALSLAAALSIQSPFTNNSYKSSEMMAARKYLESSHGDPITLLNTFNEWLKIKSERKVHSKRWCRQKGIEEQRFYELTKLRKQFKNLLKDCKFIDDNVQSENSTSAERSQRYGEMKQLRKMKYSYHNAPQKKKVLKLDYNFEIDNGDDNDNDNEIDIKDVEFRMSNDNRSVQELWNLSAQINDADITIIKTIACSGLFPQIAIADEHNSYKTDSDQLFHTKLKPFVVLHPMGVFATQPDILQLNDFITNKSEEFAGRGKISTNHQLLTYVSLLETTKPYLMTTMKLSACHSLLLFSNNLDTNEDFTRLICDNWLELRFVNSEDAQQLVMSAIEIRDIWGELLRNKLNETNSEDEISDNSVDCRRLERQLSGQLVEFYNQNRPQYTFCRLLAADIKHLYVKRSNEGDMEAAQQLFSWISDLSFNKTKGGIIIKDYLTYNCLNDGNSMHSKPVQKLWQCPHCEEEMMITVLEKIRHESHCVKRDLSLDDPKTASSISSNVVKRPFFCPDCQQELHLTSIEILKHKKMHSVVTK